MENVFEEKGLFDEFHNSELLMNEEIREQNSLFCSRFRFDEEFNRDLDRATAGLAPFEGINPETLNKVRNSFNEAFPSLKNIRYY